MRYIITFEESVEYEVEVEADNLEDAIEAANDQWLDSEEPSKDFYATGLGIEFVRWE